MVTNHIQEICKMCFLLNGRKREIVYTYDCGFCPKKIHTKAHGKPGNPGIDIEFNGVSVSNSDRIQIMFDNKDIFVTHDGSEFVDDESKKNAQSIFGKNANPNIIMGEAKWALAEILKEFKEEIENTLSKRHAI